MIMASPKNLPPIDYKYASRLYRHYAQAASTPLKRKANTTIIVMIMVMIVIMVLILTTTVVFVVIFPIVTIHGRQATV